MAVLRDMELHAAADSDPDPHQQILALGSAVLPVVPLGVVAVLDAPKPQVRHALHQRQRERVGRHRPEVQAGELRLNLFNGIPDARRNCLVGALHDHRRPGALEKSVVLLESVLALLLEAKLRVHLEEVVDALARTEVHHARPAPKLPRGVAPRRLP